MSEKLIILGCSGHAKVVADIAVKNEYEILGFLDDNPKTNSVLGYPVLGKIEKCLDYITEVYFVIAIGNNAIRKRVYEKYPLKYISLIHPSAKIAMDTQIGEGTVVMANAVINASASIGKQCIINTSSVIEHDCEVGDFSHISPGAVLCGTVQVGENVHIGASAAVKNNLNICSNVIVGVGAAVICNLNESGIYVGVPAKRLEK